MSQHNELALSTIGQISVSVKELDRAVSFYRDQLGMSFLFQVPNMAFFDCSGIRLMLTLPEERSGDIHTSILYYKVDDIQDAYRILKERNVRFNGRPHKIANLEDHELWMAFFWDSEMNLLALMAEIPLQQ